MSNLNAGDLSAIWQIMLKTMQAENLLSETACNLWFNYFRLDYLDPDKAVFAVENEMKKKIILEKYTDLLSSQIEKVIGFSPAIDIITDVSLAPTLTRQEGVSYPTDIVDKRMAASLSQGEEQAAPEPLPSLRRSEPEVPTTQSASVPESVQEDKPALRKTGGKDHRYTYNEDYTFENFVVGNSNQFAHAAALSVAENVGVKFNPLFIYGPPGLGKTHLMYAIANRALQRDPSVNVICVKGEEFMNELIEAIRQRSSATVEFREKYRNVDMLMIDDIQFIAGREATQEEFFHTFDALYEDHKQIIITSDRPPKELTTLEERIRSRFEAGLIADIQPPDYELRLAILKNKAVQNNLEVPIDVIDFLAENIQANIRQIEGVMKKLGAKNLLSGMPISMDMVITTLPEYLGDTEPVQDTVTRVVDIVAKRYNVTAADVMGPSRKKEIKMARNVSMYIVRALTKMSLPQIGNIFGRDHSTVYSNISMVESALTTDTIFEATVSEILKEVKRGS